MKNNSCSYFNSILDENINEDSEGLIKSGLLFYESDEGGHRDSKGRKWEVSKELLKEIVNNTNEYLQKGNIGVFMEHNKDIKNQIGVIEDYLEVRPITNNDIMKNNKLEHLKGKWGIFCDSIKILDENIINKVKKGISKNLSSGIDFGNKIIRELSLVGIPALASTSLFKSSYSNFSDVYTLKEALEENNIIEENKQKCHDVINIFIDIINNINNADEEMINTSKQNLYTNAFNDVMIELKKLLPLRDSLDNGESLQNYNLNDNINIFSLNQLEQYYM